MLCHPRLLASFFVSPPAGSPVQLSYLAGLSVPPAIYLVALLFFRRMRSLSPGWVRGQDVFAAGAGATAAPSPFGGYVGVLVLRVGFFPDWRRARLTTQKIRRLFLLVAFL